MPSYSQNGVQHDQQVKKSEMDSACHTQLKDLSAVVCRVQKAKLHVSAAYSFLVQNSESRWHIILKGQDRSVRWQSRLAKASGGIQM